MKRFACLLLLGLAAAPSIAAEIRKTGDIVIYQNEKFYSAFPSIVRRPDGELLVTFRRAPNRRLVGESGYTHTDPNSYLVMVRSKDNGQTWTSEPAVIFAHPFGGSQDPCMVQLQDGTLVCSSYAWMLTSTRRPRDVGFFDHRNFSFLGGFLIRSSDGGKNWSGPFVPPTVPAEKAHDSFGKPLPAYNRGAMCQGRHGRLFWVVCASNTSTNHTGTHLLISSDNGQTWQYSCRVAEDEKVTFNETSIYETPRGELVAFMRTGDFDDHTAIARSVDGGKSFQPWQDAGFQGHPHYALRLPTREVLLVYGYRHPPFGVRARVLNPECTNFKEAPEIVLRNDGGSVDLGYPWATMLGNDSALVVYYFNIGDGLRHIAGTFLKIAKAPN